MIIRKPGTLRGEIGIKCILTVGIWKVVQSLTVQFSLW